MAVHRGRKSVAELQAPPLKLVESTRMKAPPMAPAAQRVWRLTLGSFPADFFRPCDTALLKVFCNASANADEAARLLEHEGLTIDNGHGRKVPHPAVAILSMAAATISSTAAKLRIAPNARMRIDASATRANAEPTASRPWS